MKNNLSRIINKIASIFKKEIMLSVSLLAAIVSLFITPPQVKLLYDIDWENSGNFVYAIKCFGRF